MKKTVLIVGLVLSAGAVWASAVVPMPLPRPIVVPAPIVVPDVRPQAAVLPTMLEARVAAVRLAEIQA